MDHEPNPRTTRVLSIDERPGRLPKITSDGPDIAYALAVRGTTDQVRLILRCDAAGAVWSSIRSCD